MDVWNLASSAFAQVDHCGDVTEMIRWVKTCRSGRYSRFLHYCKKVAVILIAENRRELARQPIFCFIVFATNGFERLPMGLGALDVGHAE